VKQKAFVMLVLVLLALGMAGCHGSTVVVGRPTLLFFYSEHCPFCQVLMPKVNDLEQDYRGQLGVIYVSMDEAEGRDIAGEHGVLGTPTILLLDGEGEQFQVLRGSIPTPLIEQAVEDLLAAEG